MNIRLSFLRALIGPVTLGLILGLAGTDARFRAHAQSPKQITVCDDSVWDQGVRDYVIANDLTASGGLPCLSPSVDNITIDGNNKTITTNGGNALAISNHKGITVRNLTTNGGFVIDGDLADNNLLDGITSTGSVAIYDGDGNVVNNSIIGGYLAFGRNANAVTGEALMNSTVEGSAPDLVEIVGSEQAPCPRGDHLIMNNTFTNNQSGTPTDAWATLRIRCTTNSTVTGNIIHSTGSAIGLYLRDDSNDGRYEGNTFWTSSAEALRIASGNADKGNPSRNTFRNNIFRAENASSFYIQGIGTGNQFLYNIVWGTSDDSGATLTGGFGNAYDHNTFYVTGSNHRAFYMTYRDGPPADTFTNNIVDYNGPFAFKFDGFAFDRLTSDYNLFRNRSGAVTFEGYGSLASWRTQSAAAGDAEDAHSIEADPLFNNPATGNFSLKDSSPARGAGSGGTDIGAYGTTQSFGCDELWTCGSWSSCTDGRQTRTCTDQHQCGTTFFRPLLSKSCTQADQTAPSGIRDLRVQ